MERLIEQPSGEGGIFEGETYLGRVHYRLSVYSHFSEIESEPVPPHLEVEGRIVPLSRLDLADLHQRQAELTLHLTDGRALDLWVTNQDGAIRSTALGLRTPRL